MQLALYWCTSPKSYTALWVGDSTGNLAPGPGAVSYHPVSLTSVPGKIMVQIILEDTSKHTEEAEVLKTAQHKLQLLQGKQYQTHLVALDEGMTALVDKG